MKLATLRRLFIAEHSGGDVYRHPSYVDTICIHYGVGKVYQYRTQSVYALAERLGLIPDIDTVQTAESIVRELGMGTESVTASAGATDTARHLWHSQGHEDTIISTKAGLDEYDRPLAIYTIMTNDRWV